MILINSYQFGSIYITEIPVLFFEYFICRLLVKQFKRHKPMNRSRELDKKCKCPRLKSRIDEKVLIINMAVLGFN